MFSMNIKDPKVYRRWIRKCRERNKRIAARYLKGDSMAEIGRTYGLTRQRIAQILSMTKYRLAQNQRNK